MARFLIGLVLGGCGSAITWAATENTGWTVAIGFTVAVLVWFGEFILPEHTYKAENAEHAGCGGDVHLIHLHDGMGGLLGAHSRCAKCGEDLTP